MNQKTETKKKPSRQRLLIAFGLFAFWIFVFFLYAILTDEPKSDPESEKILLDVAAKQLKKDPNELTDEDFAQMTELRINTLTILQRPRVSLTPFQSATGLGLVNKPTNISDLRMLKKFPNLEELELNHVYNPKLKLPQWMEILDRIGIMDYQNRIYLDLRPVAKLKHLKLLYLSHSEVKNIEPLAKLTNLETLYLDGTQVSDLEPLKKLRNLKYLKIGSCKNLSVEQINDLQKALPELEIIFGSDYMRYEFF